ncbi:MAG: hypothetical protein DRQ40_07715 [Gammaproteobacteria bacterium]|nr:MAG: hypothetical protein DRQ40_07715 [Gammaproteobacteria bacterium]
MAFMDVYAVQQPLSRLVSTGCVVLSMKGGVSVVKRQYKDPILIIQTTETLQIGKGGLLVTLVGYSSKILDRQDLRISPLILIGLTATAAGLLLDELKTLYIN